MFKRLIKQVAGVCLMLAAVAAAAQTGVVQSLRGDARARSGGGALAPLSVGQVVGAGTQLVTGEGGEAVVRFTDGHMLALKDNSTVGIAAYVFDRQQPAASSFVMELFRGGLRSVTGLLGKSNPQAFRLAAGNSTIGIRGSDWIAALDGDSLFTGVTDGGITVSNQASSLLVDAGQFSATLAPGAAPQLVLASQLPAGIFGSLPQLQLAVAGNGAGSGGATNAAAGTLSGAQLAVGAGLLGAAAAAASAKGGSGTAGTTGTSGTTGTTRP